MLNDCTVCHKTVHCSQTPSGAYACQSCYMLHNDIVRQNREASLVTAEEVAMLMDRRHGERRKSPNQSDHHSEVYASRTGSDRRAS